MLTLSLLQILNHPTFDPRTYIEYLDMQTISNLKVVNYKVLDLFELYIFDIKFILTDLIWKSYDFFCAKQPIIGGWSQELDRMNHHCWLKPQTSSDRHLSLPVILLLPFEATNWKRYTTTTGCKVITDSDSLTVIVFSIVVVTYYYSVRKVTTFANRA